MSSSISGRAGATQDVTEGNQEEYIDLIVAHRITGQFRAFTEGLGCGLLLDLLRVCDKHELELPIGRDDGDRHGRLDAVHRLPQVRENGEGDRVVLGMPPLVACGAPAPQPAPLYDREERGPEQPPTQPHVLPSPRPAAVRGP